MTHQRIVVGYHACDAEVAHRLVDGEPFIPSRNAYDWLGHGVYFWEHSELRARLYAAELVRRERTARPAVLACALDLTGCFDLCDAQFSEELAEAYPVWSREQEAHGIPIPDNRGMRRDRDCAALDWYLEAARVRFGRRYTSVRSIFEEGPPLFPGSRFRRLTHVQVAIRDQGCILDRQVIWEGTP